eukprot:350217-Chlamydomonas_euryale.AAC.3
MPYRQPQTGFLAPAPPGRTCSASTAPGLAPPFASARYSSTLLLLLLCPPPSASLCTCSASTAPGLAPPFASARYSSTSAGLRRSMRATGRHAATSCAPRAPDVSRSSSPVCTSTSFVTACKGGWRREGWAHGLRHLHQLGGRLQGEGGGCRKRMGVGHESWHLHQHCDHLRWSKAKQPPGRGDVHG